MKQLPKILIVAPGWVGDVVIANALCKSLKSKNPQTKITVLASPAFEPLLKRMQEVDDVILAPFGHGDLQLIKRFRLAKQLRHENFSQAIVLPNSLKSALIPYWAKIPVRTGWRGEMRYFLLNDLRVLTPSTLPLIVQRYVALGAQQDHVASSAHYSLPTLHTNDGLVSATLQKLHLALPQQPLLIFCPGAEYGEAKRWPTAYFAEVVTAKAKEGFKIWILGGTKDQTIAREIQEQSGNVGEDLTGKTNLGEVVDLLSLATVVVTNDTGLMHIAAALQKNLIAIFGSSSPQFTPPLSPQAKILRLNLECSPCFKRTCPLGHLKCLRDLRPELVLQAIDSLLVYENSNH
jgi:heptosyltransferase II